LQFPAQLLGLGGGVGVSHDAAAGVGPQALAAQQQRANQDVAVELAVDPKPE
jgi:hypothetical protein